MFVEAAYKLKAYSSVSKNDQSVDLEKADLKIEVNIVVGSWVGGREFFKGRMQTFEPKLLRRVMF